MRNEIGIPACMLVALCLGGCFSPVRLDSHYTTPPPPHDNTVYAGNARPVPPPPPLIRCMVYLESVQDQRTDKNSMGNIGGRPVDADDMVQWLDSGLDTLSASGFRIDKATSVDDQVVVDVTLLKAYMISMGLSKSANMVVRITYKRPDGSMLATQVYRGVDTSVDWVAGEGEMNSAFQRATKQMLDQVDTDLGGYCKSSSRVTYLEAHESARLGLEQGAPDR